MSGLRSKRETPRPDMFPGLPLVASPDLVEFARRMRAEALALGELDIASRLDAAIEQYPREYGE